MARLSPFSIRLPASSLLEVMVALVVISAVFALSMGLYVNVTSSSYHLQQGKAFLELERLAAETKKEQKLVDENIVLPTFSIEKKIKEYSAQKGVLHLHLVARDAENKVLAELHQLVIIEK
jgi:competence protein ComGF